MIPNRSGCLLTIACVFVALVPSCGAAVAERWTDLADTVFHHVAQNNELPTAAIPTAFGQDSDGFLWIGSQNGLARWDGYNFRVYRSDPSVQGSLPDGFISTMHIDNHKRFWIGTASGGLARFDREHDRFVGYTAGQNGLSHVGVTSLADDDSDGIWIGTVGGLDHLDPLTGSIRHVRHDVHASHSLPSDSVGALLRDRKGVLWIGTDLGLVKSNGKTPIFSTVPLPVPRGEVPSIASLFEDRAGRVWIGTKRHGAFIVEPNGTPAQRVLVPPSLGVRLETLQVSAITEISPSEVWLGTFGQGIVAVNPFTLRTRWIRHNPLVSSSLSNDTIWAFYHDRSGLIWVATDRSVSNYNPHFAAISTVFGSSGNPHGLSNENVHSVLVSKDGDVWLGAGDNGVDILDPAGARISQLRPKFGSSATSLPRAAVDAAVEAPGGTIFLGTEQGLYRTDLRGRNLARLAMPTTDPGAAIWSLLVNDQVLWIGGVDGLRMLDLHAGAKHGIQIWNKGPLTDPRVTTIASSSPGQLWVGTVNGLNWVDTSFGKVERLLPDPKDPSSLSARWINTLASDRFGRLWVGTSGGGINVLVGRDAEGHPRFHHLGIVDGLPNDDINKLVTDQSGNIWASTDNGLASIDPNSFAVHALGYAEGGAVSNYWVGSGTVSPQGEVLFGGIGGFTIIRPSALTPRSNESPAVIVNIRVNGKRASAIRSDRDIASDLLDVAPNPASLLMEFSALNYSAPERVRYAYRLEGHDKDWIDTDAAHRIAAYTDLAPGTYVLRIRSSNPDGVWTDSRSPLLIRVRAAWYQTIWFRLAEIVLGLFLVTAIVHLRTQKLRYEQQQLELKIVERTAELEESRRELERIAYIDFLTGLPNRRMFSDAFNQTLARASRHSESFVLLLIDLDEFKSINDTYGHDVGDVLLAQVANRLRAVLRTSDTVARMGGDEFGILLAEDHDPSAIEGVCRRIFNNFATSIECGNVTLNARLCIGIAAFPLHGITTEALYKSADMALYEAKRAGGGTHRWCPSESHADQLRPR